MAGLLFMIAVWHDVAARASANQMVLPLTDGGGGASSVRSFEYECEGT
jgi:hypothetical protein